MSIQEFDEIIDFILENRGDSSFILQTQDDIRDYIIMALNTDTCIIHKDISGNVDGILCWEITKYIPLSVELTECISKGGNILTDMLLEFKNIMPTNFRCFAKRKKASQTIEYKNHWRILRLFQHLNYTKV